MVVPAGESDPRDGSVHERVTVWHRRGVPDKQLLVWLPERRLEFLLRRKRRVSWEALPPERRMELMEEMAHLRALVGPSVQDVWVKAQELVAPDEWARMLEMVDEGL